MRDSRKKKPYASWDQFVTLNFQRKRTEFKYVEKIENTQNKALRNVFLELFSAGETVYLKTIKTARVHENITLCNTISSGFAEPQEHTDG